MHNADRFHAIPGKNRAITVDVVAKKKSGSQYIVKEVRFDGVNILWIDDDSIVSAFADESGYRKMSIKDFEKRLSDEMVVPARLLTVTYQFDEKTKPTLLFPEGGTTRKR